MDIKLKEKYGTYKTFSRIIFLLKKTMPKSEAITKFPLGSLMVMDLICLYDVKFEKEKKNVISRTRI